VNIVEIQCGIREVVMESFQVLCWSILQVLRGKGRVNGCVVSIVEIQFAFAWNLFIRRYRERDYTSFLIIDIFPRSTFIQVEYRISCFCALLLVLCRAGECIHRFGNRFWFRFIRFLEDSQVIHCSHFILHHLVLS